MVSYLTMTNITTYDDDHKETHSMTMDEVYAHPLIKSILKHASRDVQQ